MPNPHQLRLANSSKGELVKLVELPEPDDEAERLELIAAVAATIEDPDTELITNVSGESGDE